MKSGPAAADFGRGQGGELRASPKRAVSNEPTPATGKRRAARRVFAQTAVWLRCSSLTDPAGIRSLIAPSCRAVTSRRRSHPAFCTKTGPLFILMQALWMSRARARARRPDFRHPAPLRHVSVYNNFTDCNDCNDFSHFIICFPAPSRLWTLDLDRVDQLYAKCHHRVDRRLRAHAQVIDYGQGGVLVPPQRDADCQFHHSSTHHCSVWCLEFGPSLELGGWTLGASFAVFSSVATPNGSPVFHQKIQLYQYHHRVSFPSLPCAAPRFRLL